ncbi:MAG TPA: response regulator transcription factor [Dehalococcoidia bacterium]|nr:response regulator transcription factor [Dehalococcoidia bacterium]
MPTVLLVDASEELQQFAADVAAAGYAVATATAADAFAAPREETPALVVLNLIGARDRAPFAALLRSPDLPLGVASLAAVRADDLPRLDLTLGFDDFIVLPAPAAEVAARIRHAIWVKSGVESDNVLRQGDLHIDLANYKVYIAGRPVELTYKEYELLRFLATNADKVFTREALLNRVWGYDFYGGSRTVDVHIRRLRSKIEDRTHTFIETVRNVGYRFHLG